ncbi:hypothetical protein AAFN86_12965 [Roseomonas sp. CAU 1739]|uniref:hypothetical protein n=1 Tax=Roseomonas sp. CAU 1739 TaxID=3140364 RepID=UPI00325BE0B0
MLAVVVHALDQAEAALAAAGPRGVLLLSAHGAGGFAGPGWFLALVAEAGRRHPDARWDAALDCADAAGSALAAVRAGVRVIILDGTCAGFAAVAAAAAETGARLLPARPPAFDLAGIDLRRRDDLVRLAAWLAMEVPQASTTPPAS